MPSLFSRLKGKDGDKIKSNKHAKATDGPDTLASEPKWDDSWTRKTVEPEEVQELISRCTEELKARALDLPFLLLPFRPTSDPSAVRTFVRNFFDGYQNMRGAVLAQELLMTEPMVISGVIKWCWSRLPGGVVGWDSYELFKVGEQDSNMARDSFRTFIPLSVENETRSRIIFDFFDLLAAIAAHGKANGMGGRKLSRMAAWWTFDYSENNSKGFDGGYRTWLRAADATSHLFFAYIRSMNPEPAKRGISMLPISLEKLLAETEYPPQRPSLLQSRTNRVVMIVETVSPTPFSLLRRANHFQYRDDDEALRDWSEYEDPVEALTEECRRVLRAISAANQSQAVSSSKHSTSLRDASWSRFEDIGFTCAAEDDDDYENSKMAAHKSIYALRTSPRSGPGGRPTTPSWADFLSSGFVADGANRPANVLLPPDKILPPIETAVRQRSSQSHKPRLEGDGDLEPGELASITRFDLDDAFWWVWMSSLAPEETADRKSAFGRCAVVETVIRTGRWLVIEEMVKGAVSEPEPGAYMAEKKGFFGWTRRNKGALAVSRRKSTASKPSAEEDEKAKQKASIGFTKANFGSYQQAKIQAAAQQLQARQRRQDMQQHAEQNLATRRGRTDVDVMNEKTNSTLTIQPGLMSEASPAVKWANKYDKETIRETYLANAFAGRGPVSPTALAPTPTPTNGRGTANGSYAASGAPSRCSSSREGPSSAQPASPQPAPFEFVHAQRAGPEPDSSPPSPPEKEYETSRDVYPSAMSDQAGRSMLPPPPPPPPVPEKNNVDVPFDYHDLSSSPENRKRANKLHKDKEKEHGPGGFRKLFGRKKIRPSQGQDHHSPGVIGPQMGGWEEPVDVPPVVRPNAPSPARSLVPPPASPSAEEEAEAFAERDSDVEPVESVPVTFEPVYEDLEHENEYDSPVGSDDVAEADHEFSRFDQGPLTEQPAFMPNDARDVAPAPFVKRASRTSSSARFPERQTLGAEVTPKAGPVVQDRWAKIRQNAADRAARQSEQQRRLVNQSKLPAPAPAPATSRPAQTTDEDGDTSAEESLESRVARIKARVAELTNNMDGVNKMPPQSIRR